ncbi:MAG: type II toxin-antitoxin system Phd/YefM family antitoxin [Microlunatus sp.]
MVLEIPVTEARAQFAELINRVGYGGEEIVLTRHGKPLVALVPATNLRSQQNPATEQVLDLTSTRGSTRDEFGLAARNNYPPPRAGG